MIVKYQNQVNTHKLFVPISKMEDNVYIVLKPGNSKRKLNNNNLDPNLLKLLMNIYIHIFKNYY
jgi:hypothetical protein